MSTIRREENAPHDAMIRSLLDRGYRFNAMDGETRKWTPAAVEKYGRDYDILRSFVAFGTNLAVDWDHLGCVVLSGDVWALPEKLGEPVYATPEVAVYRGVHPGARTWRVGDATGRFVAKSKQWFPVELDRLGEIPAENTAFECVFAGATPRGPNANNRRKTKLKALQSDLPATLEALFPGDPHRPEGDGWRVSTNGMKDNVAVTRLDSGDYMFKDFGEPPAFEPGDALSVMHQLGVSRGTSAEHGSQSERPQMADKGIPVSEKPAFKTAPKPDADEKRKAAQRLWRGALDLLDDADECAEALAYLSGRGVALPEGAMLRYEPECPMGSGSTEPCLVAAATADLNPGRAKGVTAVQRISLKGAKKTLGKVEGAVNVSGQPVADTLGVAEGVVTGLAAQAHFDTPFVATLGTGGMKTLTVPESVTRLLIAADNDENGQGKAAALALAHRYAHLKVRVVMPSKPGADFADKDFGEVVEVDSGEVVARSVAGDLVDLEQGLDLLGGTEERGVTLFAHLFIERHGRNYRHDSRRSDSNGAWVRWQHNTWTRRDRPPAMAMANIVRVQCAGDPKAMKDFDRSSTWTGALKLVAEGCERQVWDAEPTLLGLPGGLVLDLKTGDVREQAQGDYITRSTNTMPADDAGEWPALVRELCSGDESKYGYVQALAVDCATGHAGKDLLPIIHGEPGTGKSTVFNAIHRALGSYSQTIDSKHLLVSRSPAHLSWLAGLVDARMALTSEVPPGSTWNGPLVCTITGGDAVSANFMRKDHFQFVPQFRLITLVNDLPTIPTAESGVNRRARVVPFTNKVAGQGMGEDESIRDFFLGEGRGHVLRWLADSAREVNARDREHRYPHCQAVADATAEYVQDRSDFDTWAAEALVREDAESTLVSDAHGLYLEWAKLSGRQALGERAFGMELSRRMGVKSQILVQDGARRRGYRGWSLQEVKVAPRSSRPRW